MKLSASGLLDRSGWEQIQVKTPSYNIQEMKKRTAEDPLWVHFGSGNFFRGFVAPLAHRLLETGELNRGIITVSTYNHDIIHRIYEPYDNLMLRVLLGADGTLEREVIGSVAEAIPLDQKEPSTGQRCEEIFKNPGLQMVSLTITEKGYALEDGAGNLLPLVEEDMEQGPGKSTHVMGILAGLLYQRYLAGELPLALVSMDNCAENGTRLGDGIKEMAKAWEEKGLVAGGFLAYLEDESKIATPWTMVDKITPRPDDQVAKALAQLGIEGMEPIVTSKTTYIAPYVNAERPEYLVIEDKFPAGRPPLEKVGVYLTDRETVSKTERMKVTTCLNPLHTAMSVYGCLLGYTRISQEMKDPEIVSLIRRLGYLEGLPVVVDPGILSPKAFLDEVVEQRFPNPFMPDAPQRIATDTSQKVGIRFGETIKSYQSKGMDVDSLVAVPLALAGWLRYLLAVDDKGDKMAVSPDPLLDQLQEKLSGVVWNDPSSYQGQIREILRNAVIFGSDLTKTSLGDKIEAMFIELLAGPGAVRATLQKHLKEGDLT